MSDIQKLKDFYKHIVTLAEQRTDNTITVELANKSVTIPFTADSYEVLLRLVEQEIDYLRGK